MDQDSKIVLPLINGVSINSSSMTEFRKYVVDTRDRTLEQIKDISEAAYDFLISRQDKRINSINLSKEYESWRERWWQHWRTRIDYINKNGFSDALCYCIVTKYPIPRHVHFVVPTHSCIIFAVSEQ